MKRRHGIYFIVSLFIALGGVSNIFAEYPAATKPTVYINDEKCEVQAVNAVGTTLVPFRIIFEKYGLQVQWDNLNKTVTAFDEEINMQLTWNSDYALVNGEKRPLVIPAAYSEEHNMFYVPLRFVLETIGAKVTWDKKSDEEAYIYISFSDK